jgi:hypothetical protein
MDASEQRAAQVLAGVPAYVWDGRALPVPVEEIAESCAGLRVADCEDLREVPGAPALAPGEALSGLLVVDRREIWVNATEAAGSPGRRRFTIGHELGHWFLHASAHSRIFCRAPALDAGAVGAPDIEAQASAFAARLLFPGALVREEHAALGGDLVALCERFGGSRVATERAVFRSVYRPALASRTRGLACFFHDDEGYAAWRAAHAGAGYLVNDDLGDPAAGRLHRLDCSYLSRPAAPGQPRTRQPKWCALDAGALRRAFPDARPCGRCRP